MLCPECQFENRNGAKYCGKCRTRFGFVCPQCDSRNLSENEFCDECGHKLIKHLEPKKRVLEGERSRPGGDL